LAGKGVFADHVALRDKQVVPPNRYVIGSIQPGNATATR
jgi:hypothetical protein